jgi:hypothetical protein
MPAVLVSRRAEHGIGLTTADRPAVAPAIENETRAPDLHRDHPPALPVPVLYRSLAGHLAAAMNGRSATYGKELTHGRRLRLGAHPRC